MSSGLRQAPARWPPSPAEGEACIPYDAFAVIPEADWRVPTDAEFHILCDTDPAPDPGSSITVVRMPENVLDSLAQARDVLRSVKDIVQANDYFSRQDGLRYAFDYAYQFTDQDDINCWPSGVRVNPPGLPTVTIDSRSGNLVGLHVDNWVNSPLAERDSSPGRIAMNLGLEDRYLIYVNLPLTRIWQLAHAPADANAALFEPDIITRFVRSCPTYPAVRIRIAPGEAYIAPTDNIIHDGSTAGMTQWDFFFTVIGHFSPRRSRPDLFYGGIMPVTYGPADWYATARGWMCRALRTAVRCRSTWGGA